MSEASDAVGEFHTASSHHPDLNLARALLMEEMGELSDALYEPESEHGTIELVTPEWRNSIIKEMADVLYTLYGFARRFGVDLDEAFRRVHQSNMSKANPDGTFSSNQDGKIIKGTSYRAPELGDL